MRSKIFIPLLLLFVYNSTFCQIDSTKRFENSKGTWLYPICHFNSVSDCTIDSRRTVIYPVKNIVFNTDSSYIVNAVFEGRIVGVHKIGNAYMLITKFGDYYLSYVGLDKPTLKVGDYLLTGQRISSLKRMDDLRAYELEIHLTTKTDGDIFPCDWFLKRLGT